MVGQDFNCMVHTQSKNKDDVERAVALQQEVNSIPRDMHNEVSAGRMVIPDLSNTASPLSNMCPVVFSFRCCQPAPLVPNMARMHT